MLKLARYVCLLFVGIFVIVVVVVAKTRHDTDGEVRCLVAPNGTSVYLLDTTFGITAKISDPLGSPLRKLHKSGMLRITTDTSDVFGVDSPREDWDRMHLVSFDRTTGQHWTNTLDNAPYSVSRSADRHYLAASSISDSGQKYVHILTVPDLQDIYIHDRPLNTSALSVTSWSNSGHLFAFLERNKRNEGILTITDAETLRSTSVVVIPDLGKTSAQTLVSIQWSADDEAIVVYSTATIAVYLIGDKTIRYVGEELDLSAVSGRSAPMVVWIAHTHQIAYTPLNKQGMDLWIYDADSRINTMIARQMMSMIWYSDDRSHAITATSTNNTLTTRLVNLLTREQIEVRSDSQTRTSNNVYWLDGKRVAIAFADKFVWMNYDGSNRHEVNIDNGSYGPYLSSQHLMPYLSLIDSPTEVGVIDLETGIQRKLGQNNGSYDVLPSPDEHTIATLSSTTPISLSLFAVDGSRTATIVINNDYVNALEWSPDSARIALFTRSSKKNVVHIFASTGEQLKVIDFPPAQMSLKTATWSNCQIPEHDMLLHLLPSTL